MTQAIARAKAKRRIEFDVESHLKALIFNRLEDPGSELRLLTWLEAVYLPGIDRQQTRYECLLRAMDFLIEHKRVIENAIARRLSDLFNQGLKLRFYDLTSTYFEAEASLQEDDIRQFGYSRDHRPDREQILVGVAMIANGIPVAHYTFPGNTANRAMPWLLIEDIRRRFGVKRVTLVADKGMVSGRNLLFLLESGQDFILGESAQQSKPAREVIRKAAAHRQEHEPDSENYVYETKKEKTLRIRAHVMVCFLAFQMAALFEKRLAALKLTWERAFERLRAIKVIEWERDGAIVKGLVRSKEEQLSIFRAIGTAKLTLSSL